MQQIMAQKRMAQQQAQVDEVVGIMRNNVEKVLERDQKLNELDEKADALQDGASQFEKSAGKLKNKFWVENMKMIVICCLLGLLVLGLLYWNYSKDEAAQNQTYFPPQRTGYKGYGPEGAGAGAGAGDTGHHQPDTAAAESKPSSGGDQ